MSGVTQTLRAQHQAVKQLMIELDQALANQQLALIGTTLLRLKGVLLSHLQLEDRELYPSLGRLVASKGDERSSKTVALFSQSVPRISGALTEFLASYDRVIKDVDKFERDWVTVKNSLAMRMQSEEAILYPLHDQLAASSPPVAPGV